MAKITTNGQQIPLSADVLKSLLVAGHRKSDIARMANVHRSTITRSLLRINASDQLDSQIATSLTKIFLTNIAKGSEIMQRVLDYVSIMDNTTFASLSHKDKIGYGQLANIALGTSYDKYRIETGKGMGEDTPRIVINVAGDNVKVGLQVSANQSKAIVSDNPTIECSHQSGSE